MKNLNRWVYAIAGVVVLLMAGLIYAWSEMSQPIASARPDWTAAQLSLAMRAHPTYSEGIAAAIQDAMAH